MKGTSSINSSLILILDQEMDGTAIIQAFGSTAGSDCIKDV